MSWEGCFVLGLLAVTLGALMSERWGVHLVAICTLAVLGAVSLLSHSERLPSVEDFLNIAKSPAALTILAMFIVSAALENCGLVNRISGMLGSASRLSYGLFIVTIALGVGLMSAFVNNTPMVVVLTPVLVGLAAKMKLASSKLLIPLSYVSIFGGMCTLIGSSTNILANGILKDNGMEGLGMFELGAFGAPAMVCATGYLAIWGYRLLPSRPTLTGLLGPEQRREFTMEASIQEGSSLIGKTFKASSLHQSHQVRLLEVLRGGNALEGSNKNLLLAAGDVLILSGHSASLAQVQERQLWFQEQGLGIPVEREGSVVEALVGPRCPFLGHRLRDLRIRFNWRVRVLAVHRKERNFQKDLKRVRLQLGDTLLLMGTREDIEALEADEGISVLSETLKVVHQSWSLGATLASCGLALLVLGVSLGWFSMVAAAMVLASLFVLVGLVRLKDAVRSVSWSMILLIYAMLSLGAALQSSGLSAAAAELLVGFSGGLPEPWRVYLALALVYVLTNVLTELLSNQATVVLMAPLSIGLALSMGVDPRAFVIATCIAASASFASPLGYQTNTYIYGVGGYRFADFTRIGLPLNILYFVLCMLLVPWLWPLQPS